MFCAEFACHLWEGRQAEAMCCWLEGALGPWAELLGAHGSCAGGSASVFERKAGRATFGPMGPLYLSSERARRVC